VLLHPPVLLPEPLPLPLEHPDLLDDLVKRLGQLGAPRGERVVVLFEIAQEGQGLSMREVVQSGGAAARGRGV
jgi:hypothetical protein